MNLFIDTETTGLPRGRVQPRIVSIAWIVADAPTLAEVHDRQAARLPDSGRGQ